MRIQNALETRLNSAGVDEVRVLKHKIRATKLLAVVTPRFRGLRYGEHQDLVWRITGEARSDDGRLLISTNDTLTPDELGPDEEF